MSIHKLIIKLKNKCLFLDEYAIKISGEMCAILTT